MLGDLAGKDVLELGCGAAQKGIKMARRGARVVGLDASARQLGHARRAMAGAGVRMSLVLANAEEVPLHRPASTRWFATTGPAFARAGLIAEDLVETRPPEGARSTYRDAEELAWSRRFPAEVIWRTRRRR